MPGLREAKLRYANYYKSLLREANELYAKGGDNIDRGLSLFDGEWQNIEWSQEWIAADVRSNKEFTELCANYPGYGGALLSLRLSPALRIKWLSDALTAIAQLESPYVEGGLLNDLGIAYSDLGEFQRAIEICSKALSIHQKNGDREGEAASLINLGVAYHNLGKSPLSIRCYEKALDYAQAVGDWKRQGRILGNLGSIFFDLGNLEKALSYHQQHLAIARKIDDLDGEGKALGNLGAVQLELGYPKKAIAYITRHIEIARAIGNKREEATSLINLGNTYSQISEYSRAIEYYKSAESLARESQNHPEVARALYNRATVYYETGEREKAISLASAALKIYESIEAPDREIVEIQLAKWRESGHADLMGYGEGNAFGNLGNIYAELEDFHRAIEYYDRHIEIARDIGDARGEGLDLWNKSLALYDLGIKDEAIHFAEAALKILDQIGHPMAVEVHASLGQWKRINGIKLHLDELRRKALSDWYTSKFLYEYNELMQGLDYAQSALDVFHQIGDPNEARIKEQVVRWHSGRRSNLEEAEDFWCMSLAYSDLGDFEQAIALGKSALELFEELGSPNTIELQEKIFEWRRKSQRKISPKIERKPEKKWWQFWR